MNCVESIRGINGELLQFLPIIRISSIVVPIWPQPELGVGVEAVGQNWNWIQGLDKVTDVPHLWLREGRGSWPSFITWIVSNPSLSPVEVPVPVRVNSNTVSSMTFLWGSCLPPESVIREGVGITIWVGRWQEVPVDVVKILWMFSVVLHQLPDNEGGNSGGDPLSGMDTSLQPDIGFTRSSLES